MKVSYVESLASYFGSESCVHIRKGVGEALTGVSACRVLSREIHAPWRKLRVVRGAEAVEISRRPHRGCRFGKAAPAPRAVTDPVHARKHFAREPGGPRVFCNIECRARREAFGRTPISHGAGKSDCWVVPKKPPNKAGAEMAWRRAKGNPSDGNAYRTPSRVHATSVRGPIRLAAFCWPDHHDPRQEPYAVVPHVRICGGGAG